MGLAVRVVDALGIELLLGVRLGATLEGAVPLRRSLAMRGVGSWAARGGRCQRRRGGGPYGPSAAAREACSHPFPSAGLHGSEYPTQRAALSMRGNRISFPVFTPNRLQETV